MSNQKTRGILARIVRSDRGASTAALLVGLSLLSPSASGADASKTVPSKPIEIVPSLDDALFRAHDGTAPILVLLDRKADGAAARGLERGGAVTRLAEKMVVTILSVDDPARSRDRQLRVGATHPDVFSRYPGVAQFIPIKPAIGFAPQYVVLTPDGALVAPAGSTLFEGAMIDDMTDAIELAKNPASAMEKQKKRITAKLLIAGSESSGSGGAARRIVELLETVYRDVVIESVSKADSKAKLSILDEIGTALEFADPMLVVLLIDKDPLVRGAAARVVRSLPQICYASRMLLLTQELELRKHGG